MSSFYCDKKISIFLFLAVNNPFSSFAVTLMFAFCVVLLEILRDAIFSNHHNFSLVVKCNKM